LSVFGKDTTYLHAYLLGISCKPATKNLHNVCHVTLFILEKAIEKWRLVLSAACSGPNVCKVSRLSTMSRLADYFVVVGYDYDKQCMYCAVIATNLVQGTVSGAKCADL